MAHFTVENLKHVKRHQIPKKASIVIVGACGRFRHAHINQ